MQNGVGKGWQEQTLCVYFAPCAAHCGGCRTCRCRGGEVVTGLRDTAHAVPSRGRPYVALHCWL